MHAFIIDKCAVNHGLHYFLLQNWNKNMAKQAQKHAERCIFATSSSGYGENIHFSYGITPDFNATVMKWYGQGKDYNYYCDQCKPGRRCSEYTQVQHYMLVLY